MSFGIRLHNLAARVPSLFRLRSVMVAQVHTKQHTQRHKAHRDRPHGKDAKLLASMASGEKLSQRKRVFRPVLTSPFAVSWPRIPKADGDTILHTLLEILCDEDGKRPKKSDHACVVGVNAVSRALESHIHAVRQDTPVDRSCLPQYLFVCVADMEPPVLVSHLPMLTGAYNAMCAGKHVGSGDESIQPLWHPLEREAFSIPAVVLVPLPRGAEFLLSTALRVRRLSALMTTTALPGDMQDRLCTRIKQALGTDTWQHGYRVPWLDSAGSMLSPHIKHVASSAPVAKGKKNATRDRMPSEHTSQA